MDGNTPDPPLPAGVADILKQLTALANPQPESTAYNPDRGALAPETLIPPSQSNSNLAPDRRVEDNTSMSIARLNRETPLSSPLDSQPAETTDYLAELRKITANAESQPKTKNPSDSRGHPTHSIAASPSCAAKPAILEWAPALRHVSSLGATNPDFQTAIQKVTPAATNSTQYGTTLAQAL
jgi:hypothetical protein